MGDNSCGSSPRTWKVRGGLVTPVSRYGALNYGRGPSGTSQLPFFAQAITVNVFDNGGTTVRTTVPETWT